MRKELQHSFPKRHKQVWPSQNRNWFFNNQFFLFNSIPTIILRCSTLSLRLLQYKEPWEQGCEVVSLFTNIPAVLTAGIFRRVNGFTRRSSVTFVYIIFCFVAFNSLGNEFHSFTNMYPQSYWSIQPNFVSSGSQLLLSNICKHGEGRGAGSSYQYKRLHIIFLNWAASPETT